MDKIRFRFHNEKTNKQVNIDIPDNAVNGTMTEKVRYNTLICQAEESMYGTKRKDPELLPLDNYLVWTVKGNAPSSYYKEIVMDYPNKVFVSVKRIKAQTRKPNTRKSKSKS